jgi:hypothetical protein
MAKQSEPTIGTDLVTVEQVEDVLLHGGDVGIVSEDEIQTDMVRRILASGTLEEAFAQFRSVGARDLRGVPLSIDGVAWMRSSFDKGPKVYALLKCTLLADAPGAGVEGEQVTVSMGGRTTMAAFVWAQRNARMPFVGAFHMEQSAQNPERSFYVFKLEPTAVQV